MIGITGYGVAIPRFRIRADEIARVWSNTSPHFLHEELRLSNRAVLGPDEDSITLAIAAAKVALARAGVVGERIGGLFFGTATNPYDSRPACTTIAEALGLGAHLWCCDLQFSGKSGTAALSVGMAMVASGMAQEVLAVGADTLNRHVAPGDLYEYTASAGAGAFTIGTDGVVARIEEAVSYVSDLSDFFRLEGERYIRAGAGLGRPQQAVGIVEHTVNAARRLMQKMQSSPSDYTYAVFQQPFGSTAYELAAALGFAEQQLLPGLVADKIGDCGAASTLIALARVLDLAKPGDRILLASYGFGAGSDAFSLEVTGEITAKRGDYLPVDRLIADGVEVDYATATKFEYKYLKHDYPLTPFL